MRAHCLWVLASPFLIGCAHDLPVIVELSSPPTPALQEQDLRPVEHPYLRIIDLEQTLNDDQKSVTLIGTLRNEGDGPTQKIFVRVEGRDPAGAVVLSVEAEPSTDQILPGESATFTVIVENRPEVADYHVHAVSR